MSSEREEQDLVRVAEQMATACRGLPVNVAANELISSMSCEEWVEDRTETHDATSFH